MVLKITFSFEYYAFHVIGSAWNIIFIKSSNGNVPIFYVNMEVIFECNQAYAEI